MKAAQYEQREDIPEDFNSPSVIAEVADYDIRNGFDGFLRIVCGNHFLARKLVDEILDEMGPPARRQQ